MAKPHSSWTKMYRFFKPVDRPIGTAANDKDHHPDGLEYPATIAKKHHDGERGYRPPELVKYLESAYRV